MRSHVKVYSAEEIRPFINIQALQVSLLRFSFFNLLLVALIGLLMRSYSFISNLPLAYGNILHGHSHFAFGGWVMPVLLSLFLKQFPELVEKTAYHHWRNIALMMLTAAYGMLLSFPLEGYKGISISFSTLSVASGFYWALVVWKAMKGMRLDTSHRFIKWGLVYFVLSAAGPFATGPLIAMGKQGTPLYFDAIYFYQHFQYNGFFSFLVLAFLYKGMEQKGPVHYGTRVFRLFNLSCFPALALSLLWNSPGLIFNFLGGLAALLQLAGTWYGWKEWRGRSRKEFALGFVINASLVAFLAKMILQFFSAFPGIAALAFHQRNFIIAYLHLVLLGFISGFIFFQVLYPFRNERGIRPGLALFYLSLISTELLLVANALSLSIPYDTQWLAGLTFFFPAGIAWMISGMTRGLQKQGAGAGSPRKTTGAGAPSFKDLSFEKNGGRATGV
ncbi:MAG: hypothetical protein ACXVBN_00525 [Flavisolibacter sp.]